MSRVQPSPAKTAALIDPPATAWPGTLGAQRHPPAPALRPRPPVLPPRSPRRAVPAEEPFHTAALDQLELHYQPVVALGTSRLVRFEALLRWRHPRLGLLPPARFLPAAEASQAIHAIGAWVLRRATADAASWPDSMGLAINVSARQLDDDRLAQQLAAALESSGLPASRLEIELTETAAIGRDAPARRSLAALRAMGVRLALDDFGTGYGSFADLLDLPIDAVKIDRRFLAETRESHAVLASVTALARTLGIRATAEGVETAAQLARIRAHGCHEAQGFFVGRPGPLAGAMALMRGAG